MSRNYPVSTPLPPPPSHTQVPATHGTKRNHGPDAGIWLIFGFNWIWYRPWGYCCGSDVCVCTMLWGGGGAEEAKCVCLNLCFIERSDMCVFVPWHYWGQEEKEAKCVCVYAIGGNAAVAGAKCVVRSSLVSWMFLDERKLMKFCQT